MGSLEAIAKVLIILGGLIVLLGIVLLLAPRIPWLGRLPGDILIRRDGCIFYFPVVTAIILSIILTILINVLLRLFSR